jgi:hypothetical protein
MPYRVTFYYDLVCPYSGEAPPGPLGWVAGIGVM